MMDGQTFARGLAYGDDCPPIPYSIVLPERTPANLALLDREIARWQGIAGRHGEYARKRQVTVDVARRAEFAVATLSTIRMNLEIGVCCELLAVDPDERVLGALTYILVPPAGGVIPLLAIDPSNLAGSPTTVQYRGVGTALVAAASRRFLAAGVDQVVLHPLDDEARRFWLARGFQVCGRGSILCVRGAAAIEAMIDGCLTLPESALAGDLILCGLPRRVRDKLVAS
jgi:Acetyltransferase (GNAT) family